MNKRIRVRANEWKNERAKEKKEERGEREKNKS